MTRVELRLSQVASQLLRELRMTELQFAATTGVDARMVESLLRNGNLDPFAAHAIFAALSEKRRSGARIDMLCSRFALAYDAAYPSITLLWPDIP